MLIWMISEKLHLEMEPVVMSTWTNYGLNKLQFGTTSNMSIDIGQPLKTEPLGGI